MSWYNECYSWIKQQQWDNPQLSHEEQRKYCSTHCPLRERKGWAYKAFLRAMHDVFGKKTKKNSKDYNAAQMPLEMD